MVILIGQRTARSFASKRRPDHCQDLLTRLQSVEVEQIDPFDDVQQDEEEDCSDSEDSDNDEVVEVV